MYFQQKKSSISLNFWGLTFDWLTQILEAANQKSPQFNFFFFANKQKLCFLKILNLVNIHSKIEIHSSLVSSFIQLKILIQIINPCFHFYLGAYGTVYKAKDRLTGNIVALKTMRFLLTEDGVPMAILREISLLKQLERFDHPNIVR